ncbi:WEB family protein At3g51220-like [Primulina eburnea]|uniref:WEB family protein At3g51220-like n=1 Tax=Primulina eburnea TaxID=1245227 RepID=UPI003C6C41B2
MEEFYDVDENHVDYRSNVDTSRPFRSVKEAVAVFGERSLVGLGEIYSSKQPFSFSERVTPIFSPSQNVCKESWSSYGQNISLSDTVKKLEAELEETKAELKLLKEKESDTEVALAMLNAELHESMSKLAQVDHLASSITPVRGAGDMITKDGQEEKRESRTSSQNLRQILNVGQSEGLFWGKKVVKKKPIIPLVGGLFSGKKRPSTSMYTSLHSSSRLHWN